MIRNLKVLGLALVAVFAFTAISASAVLAQGTLTTDGPVTLTWKETGATSANQFTVIGLGVTCSESTYTGHAVGGGSLSSGATTITMTPHYNQSHCLTAGFPVTFDMNSCDFVFHLGATTGVDEYAVTRDLVCPEGKEMTVTVFWNATDHASNIPFCIFHIKPQVGLKGAELRDTTNGTLDLTGAVEGLHMVGTDLTTHQLFCPVAGDEQTSANGKVDFDLSITGEVPGTSNPTAIGLGHP